MLRRVFFALIAVATVASLANAAPIFYLDTATDSASAPASGLVNQHVAGLSTNGSVNIFANSDVQLAGVSLDLVATGGHIKFTGVNVANPSAGSPAANRWFALDGPQVVSDQSITSIGGAAIPGLSGNGIGQGSAEGAKVLLATVNFTTMSGGTDNLQLKIGTNTVAGWDGSFPTVFFGTQQGTGVDGGIPGGAGAVGTITVDVPEPATLSLFGLAMVGGFGAFRRRR